MFGFVTEEEIIYINEISLRLTNEEDKIGFDNPNDLNLLINFVKNEFKDNQYKTALAYCISLIVLHIFKNGNHRTSILTAEHFLLKNNLKSHTNDKKDTDLEKWRLKFEEDHDLEREFFTITCIECENEKVKEIKRIMNSEYGKTIEKWLRNNYK